MTSSSTNGKSTTAEVIVTEYQAERNNGYNRKILEDDYVYIPYRYYQPLVQSGLMEQFIHIILNVNEKLFNSKRSRYNNGDDDDDECDRKYRRILEGINLPISHNLVKSGLMEHLIHIILNVNEKLFNSKRSRYNNGDDDESDRKYRRILEEINLPVSILSTPPT
ncbi:unnamed protein product [Rotaria magnacalcarata]|uniref:Uncharacterized protein n=1 Tax=Rotaria magnacalcarata TaxID=392030 RepID=A0A816Y660_9BILA|nr:unnamed protein product [Rotaria magnacalcarata]CAF4463837.1 unnamed protein product [Rotaria magnacalcarata]